MANIGISLPKASSNKIGISVPKPKAVLPVKPQMSVAPKQMSVAPNTSIPKVGASSTGNPSISTVNGPAISTVSASSIPRKSSGGNRDNRSQLAGVGGLGIMEKLFGGKTASTADNGVSQRPEFQPAVSDTTFAGRPAVEKTSYLATAPKGATNFNTDSSGYAQRAATQQMIADADAKKQANVTALQGQIAALQAEMEQQNRNPVTDDLYSPDEEPVIKDYNQDLARLQRQLLEAEQDSPDVLEAKKREQELLSEEANIKAGLTQSIANVKEQPIPQGFLTGQSVALERQANAGLERIAAQRIPIQQQLANLQSRKQAALDLVKSQIGMKKDSRDRATDIYGKNYDRKNELQDTVIKQQEAARKDQVEQANLERKFQEDLRRFGLEYALKQKQLAVSQMNADTGRMNASKKSGLSLPEGWE